MERIPSHIEFQKPNNEKLDQKEIDEILATANDERVSADGEYFVITTPEGEIRFHAWKTIPYSETGKKEDMEGIAIEDYIKLHLDELNKHSEEGKEAA